MPTVSPKDIRKFTYYRIPVALTISEYFLAEHNVNNITLPPKRYTPPKRILIAEQLIVGEIGNNNDNGKDYIAKTLNGENTYIPHYVTSLHSDWKLLDDDTTPFMHTKTDISDCICICALTASGYFISPFYNKVALEDTAKITAYLMYTKKLTEKSICYKNTHETEYIRQHWKEFILIVRKYYKQLTGKR